MKWVYISWRAVEVASFVARSSSRDWYPHIISSSSVDTRQIDDALGKQSRVIKLSPRAKLEIDLLLYNKWKFSCDKISLTWHKKYHVGIFSAIVVQTTRYVDEIKRWRPIKKYEKKKKKTKRYLLVFSQCIVTASLVTNCFVSLQCAYAQYWRLLVCGNSLVVHP
jgi:hypothetical protein